MVFGKFAFAFVGRLGSAVLCFGLFGFDADIGFCHATAFDFEEGLTGHNGVTFHERGIDITDYSRCRCCSLPFVALRGEHLRGGLDNLTKRSRGEGFKLETYFFCLFGREYDDIFTMIVLVVVVVMVVIVCIVMVILMLMIVVMVMTVHLGMFVIMVMHFGVT